MTIDPYICKKEGGKFYFGKSISITVGKKTDAEYIKQLFESFTFGQVQTKIQLTDENVFIIGNEEAISIKEFEYGIRVNEGIFISGQSVIALLHGIYTFLDMIQYDEKGLYVQKCEIYDKPKLKNRMIHICVFPETTLDFLLRTVKICGFLKYSHIILEFWGMLKYDCNGYLGWQNAFDKNDAGLIEQTAIKAGITIVPMFNCLGHASQSRLCSGKHVMLDQKPEYFDLYEPDGWVWNIDNPKTRELLITVRKELCELFPDSKFFHIGCDEAYSYTESEEKAGKLVEYINDIQSELKNAGRTALMWGDMLFYRHEFGNDGNTYEFNIKKKEISEKIRKGLSKEIIICDWQYNANKAPYLSSKQLKNEGFNVMCCPFMEYENVKASVKTAEMLDLFGVICTTWHSLNQKFPYILESAKECWEGVNEHDKREQRNIYEDSFTKCASLVRKIDFSYGKYEKCGWLKNQI